MQVRVIDEEGGEELQQPLLHHRGAGGEGAGEASQAAPQPAPRGGTCSTAGGVANLVTTAVGAGMVALPRAVSETGILLGMLLFFGTAALTLCSTSIIVRCAAVLEGCCCGSEPKRAAATPGRLFGAAYNKAGGAALQLFPVLSSPPSRALPATKQRERTLLFFYCSRLMQVLEPLQHQVVWRAGAFALWAGRSGAAASGHRHTRGCVACNALLCCAVLESCAGGGGVVAPD